MDRSPPQQQTDAAGECRHLYLTRGSDAEMVAARCVHCGLLFRLAWQSDSADLIAPTKRNVLLAAAGLALFAGTTAFPVLLGGINISSLFLVVAVLFFTRAALGGFELRVRHGFVPGKLGPLYRRARWNPLPPKPFVTSLGPVRFPIDIETHHRFEVGDTLLFEHLRWSRMPVAIYKGARD